MTNDKQRKAAIRQVQHSAGGRYTRLAREMALPGQAFRLGNLLAECATLPSASVDWDFPENLAPAVFQSRLLGTAVPYGTVLELAGTLAQEGPSARVTLESVSPESDAIVVCRERRFQLIFTQDMVLELCQKAACPRPSSCWAFAFCPDHMSECGMQELVSMAREWGHGRREAFEHDPSGAGGSKDADFLIKTAVVSVCSVPVRDTILDACFGEPALYDDMYWDPALALAMQHAFERERLRLDEVARAEVRRIHKATGKCPSCGQRLSAWNPDIPPAQCLPCAQPRSARWLAPCGPDAH